jgi:hypothetical protein
MNSTTQSHRLYLNSSDGIYIDKIQNKCDIQCGASDIIAVSNQKLECALVKASISTSIGSFASETPKDDQRRRDNAVAGTALYVNAEMFQGSNIKAKAFNPTTSAVMGTINLRLNGSGTADATLMGDGTTYMTDKQFTLRNNVNDLIQMINDCFISHPSAGITTNILALDADSLEIGNYRVGIDSTNTTTAVVFDGRKSNYAVLKSLGCHTGRDTLIETLPAVNIQAISPYDTNVNNALTMILLKTDYNVNSYLSGDTGTHSIMGAIPIANISNLSTNGVLATYSSTAGTLVENKVSGTINYQNKNLEGSHKNIHQSHIGNIRLTLCNQRGEVLNLHNQNYFIELEIITNGTL